MLKEGGGWGRLGEDRGGGEASGLAYGFRKLCGARESTRLFIFVFTVTAIEYLQQVKRIKRLFQGRITGLKLFLFDHLVLEKSPGVICAVKRATYLKVETERHLVSIRGNARSLNTVRSAIKRLNLWGEFSCCTITTLPS